MACKTCKTDMPVDTEDWVLYCIPCYYVTTHRLECEKCGKARIRPNTNFTICYECFINNS